MANEWVIQLITEHKNKAQTQNDGANATDKMIMVCVKETAPAKEAPPTVSTWNIHAAIPLHNSNLITNPYVNTLTRLDHQLQKHAEEVATLSLSMETTTTPTSTTTPTKQAKEQDDAALLVSKRKEEEEAAEKKAKQAKEQDDAALLVSKRKEEEKMKRMQQEDSQCKISSFKMKTCMFTPHVRIRHPDLYIW